MLAQPPSPPGRHPGSGLKLIFELTNLCNFSCVHCLRDEEGPKHYLSLEIVDKVLRSAAAFQHFEHVVFTGGEPTVHPRFAELVERVADAGLDFSFITNGWSFDRVIREIESHRQHLKAVIFSLDGAREQTHDSLRRRPGSFRRIMQGISLCHFHGIAAHVNMVVTRANRPQLEEMALLAARLGCQALNIAHCQPTPDALAAGLVLEPRQRRQVEAEVAELQKLLRLDIRLAGDHFRESLLHQCPQLQMRELNIDYLGRLTACCMLSNYRGGEAETDVLADLREVSFFEGYRRLVAKIAEINTEKIARIEALDAAGAEADEREHFICTHCLDHYDKLAPAASPSAGVVQIGAGKAEGDARGN